MSEIMTVIILTSLAGICIPIGGIVASIERIGPLWLEQELRHFIIALGGGILLGAVTQVLIPEGFQHLESDYLAIFIFMLGGLGFFFLERWLGQHKHEAPQLLGMLLDYVPEAIALGGMVALDPKMAMLLALLIGLQNLPEGFNAFREINNQYGNRTYKTLTIMCALVLIGPIAGVTGMFLTPTVLGSIMLFSSGGILYLIFQDIAPQARLENHWAPPLGAILGFTIALVSKQLIH